jgi:hypothetical protein
MSPPPPRHPSRPEITLDEQPERGAVRHHPGREGADQPPPARRQTLAGGMSAIPMPPPLPLEVARTVRAPSTTTATVRETPAAGVRIPPDETTPRSRLDASLPPQSSAEGQLSALLAENARLRKAQAETERDRRAEAEAKVASFPPAVAPPVVPVAVVVNQGVSAQTLEDHKKAQTKLMLGVAAFLVAIGAPCALWLTNAAMKGQSDNKRSQVQATEAVKTSEIAKVQTSSNDKELAAVKAELAAFKLYTIVLQRRQGVAIRLPEGVREEDLPKLEFEAPLRRPGEVKPGASLIVQTPP